MPSGSCLETPAAKHLVSESIEGSPSAGRVIGVEEPAPSLVSPLVYCVIIVMTESYSTPAT